ncbi:MAG: hypothetical protein M3457_17955, partial [Chloroflexota bacterium]|nr:hypothetical protein [Chloroflexota bacterium]
MATSTTPLLGRAQRGNLPIADVTVKLNPLDDVVIAKQPLLPRTTLTSDDGTSDIVISQMIPPGHKLAIRAVAKGGP